MRVCVVGGGIVGLATARLVTERRPDASVVVLEAEASVGQHQTGRNSGVVHAAVSYEPGSRKAEWCRRGRALLETYCAERALPYERCGKVVVATREDELPRLAALHERAVANGVEGARLLDARELRETEPHATGLAALHSPGTAITDFGAVARQMATDVAAAGGEVRCGARVETVRSTRGSEAAGSGAEVLLADGTAVIADRVVVCAGLRGDQLARRSGVRGGPRIVPFRGEYFALRDARADLVRGLIYPVPDPALPFLGIHLTRRVDGSVLVGPNAVLALGRDAYRWRDSRPGAAADVLRSRALWRLAGREWRHAAKELTRSASRRRFTAEAARFVPELRAGDLVRATAGIRAQALDRDGALVDDFRVESGGPITWIRNAPSPAATSSMAMAEEIVDRLEIAG